MGDMSVKKERKSAAKKPEKRRIFRRKKDQEPAQEAAQARYVRRRSLIGMAIFTAVIVTFIAFIANRRIELSNRQLYETNRARIQTVVNGLADGGTEKEELSGEYDRLYVAKLKNTEYHFRGFDGVAFDDAFAKEAAEYADIESVAVIDGEGNALARYNCPTDFTIRRFAMLRACDGEDGFSRPFSIAYEDGVKRFFGKRVAEDRVLVFVKDWTETQRNIEGMTSWEAVLRGMVSVDTVSIAVSLKDYSFLYNPLDELTGKDALQNGVPIEALGGDYEGELTFEGHRWCAVGRPWNNAEVFVLTRVTTDMTNDVILVVFISVLFAMFASLVSAYGTVINRDNIKLGRMPAYFTLLKRRGADGEKRPLLNFNLSVARKVLPIFILGVICTAGIAFYIQSVNALSSIAYESNMAIAEIGRKLNNNTQDAERIDAEYREIYLSKCEQLTELVEENPDFIFRYDPEDENVHTHPLVYNEYGLRIGGQDEYGNVCYSVSRQPFLTELCDVNAIEKISLFDDQGRIMATNDDDWYFTLSSDQSAQSYPFWEILAEHRDAYAQDLAVDEEGEYSQYIGRAFYYYTAVDYASSGRQTRYFSREDYERQLAGEWDGPQITKHRGLLQINIAPERLRNVMRTATLTYVADHTTIHGTGHTVILDGEDDHRCVYSPKASDIGKPAANLGYSDAAFVKTGEMYNGFETVGGVEYFQTFKTVDDYDYYVGTSVPLSTVYATRFELTVYALIAAAVGLLFVFVYVCTFGEIERRLYEENVQNVELRKMRNEKDPILMTTPSGRTHKVLSVTSRWDADRILWQDRTPEQKFALVARIVFNLFAYFLFLCILLSRTGIFPINMIDYVYEGVWTKGVNIFALTNGLITLIIVFVIAGLVEVLIDNVSVNVGSRAETLGHLFTSVIHYGTALFALFYSLYLCGLDTGSLIASAGIMSLVIGLGAQSMIQDILAGVFIVFEGAFRVGDIVTIGDFRGSVLEIGLRTTKIQDTAKNIKVFNNSTLSGIINMTKETSVAAVDISICYGEDLERVEEVLRRELPLLRQRLPKIISDPRYLGVSALSASSVDLKVIAPCKEQDRLQLCRDLNRELFLIFKRNDISIPFPQVTVSYLDEESGEEGKAESREENGHADGK